MILFDYDTKVEKRENLQEDMNGAGFWDSQTEAQKVIENYKVLKAQTTDLEEVISDFDDTLVGCELAKEADDAELLAEVDEQLFKMQVGIFDQLFASFGSYTRVKQHQWNKTSEKEVLNLTN